MWGQPGQREHIVSGREQDLITPAYQNAALVVVGWWTLLWAFFMAVGCGPAVFYLVSFGWMIYRYVRRRRQNKEMSRQFVAWALAIHTVVPFLLDFFWMDYGLPWPIWFKGFWFLLCAVPIAAGVAFDVSIWYRLFDPSFPSPRRAQDRQAPVMPWYKEPGAQDPLDDRWTAETRLVRVQVESKDPNYQAGVLDLPNVWQWQEFLRRILAHPDEFTEATAKKYGVKLSLKTHKAPWYGRGFKQVRADIEERKWGRWIDEDVPNLGFELFEPALVAFQGYLDEVSPTPTG